MIKNEDVLATVLEAFRARGFEYLRRNKGRYLLTGVLHTSEGDHECFVVIPQNFDRPPSVVLKEIPQALQPVAPHIDSEGGICYLSRASIEIDIFDPVGQMLGCLERAEKVLGQLLRHELVDDLAEEFFAYWGEEFFHCFFDFKIGSMDTLHAIVDTKSNAHAAVVFVTDDVKRSTAKSQLLGYSPRVLPCPVARVYTRVEPRPTPHEWPPKTLGDLLKWQAVQDGRASRKIEERVAQAAERGADFLVVMIQSPRFFYAFLLFFSSPQRTRPSIAELRKRSVLHTRSIYPLRGWRIDEGYIIQRNVPGMKTLEHKKIIVVGCGTIGGYLADMLVKAGAGAGSGELVLIDSDILRASNLGRHRLGFPYINHKKSDALAAELKAGMPDASIRSLPVDVRGANLSKADLIIDATGEQTVSDFLASENLENAQLLHVWIEGPGVAVRAFTQRHKNEACIQCLTRLTRAGQYAATVEAMPKVYAGYGCENEYVPFPASVSMQAACLASEMVMDWVNDVASPSLRTRVVDRNFTSNATDCSPPKLTDCPACNT